MGNQTAEGVSLAKKVSCGEAFLVAAAVDQEGVNESFERQSPDSKRPECWRDSGSLLDELVGFGSSGSLGAPERLEVRHTATDDVPIRLVVYAVTHHQGLRAVVFVHEASRAARPQGRSASSPCVRPCSITPLPEKTKGRRNR